MDLWKFVGAGSDGGTTGVMDKACRDIAFGIGEWVFEDR